jgi:GNAT superfamily N-acetyltransferase
VTIIRPFEAADLPHVIDLSMRAWAPVFASLRHELGDPIFLRLHPDWTAGQADAVREACTSGDLDVFVAVDDVPVGFVAVALNAYHPAMGAVEMIAVDPDRQRGGIARELMAHAAGHMRRHGMDIAVVETGGDPGHAPARQTYEASGYTLLPIARYFQLL